MHKTSATPLAALYAALIVYASLFPFGDWRNQGLNPLTFMWQGWSPYWTRFDLGINIIGYLPFGFLLAAVFLRSGRTRYTVVLATLLAALLSFAMEFTQGFLTTRVASNVDWATNALGAWLGALLALGLARAGALARWSLVRSHWFVDDARGGIVLMALWPVALMFPTAIPLGLGQISERLEETLAQWLAGTQLLDYLPVREIELQPLLPMAEVLCVFLGALIPALLGYCIIKGGLRRSTWAVGVLLMALAATALSAALSFGPERAWDWLALPTRLGLGVAFVMALLLIFIPRRLAAALTLLALGVYLGVLNQAPLGPYFEINLHSWEQGQFIRFNGLLQWLGWLWPFAALVYVLMRVAGREQTARSGR